MGVWNTATPAGTDPKSQGDDRIRELKVAIQEALRGGATEGDEAVFPGAAPTTAPIFRYRGLKGTTAARPDAAAGGLYHNTTTGTFQRSNGTTWDDLTENAAYEAIHAAAGATLASVTGVVTLPETTNSFNVTGTEAVTSIAGWSAGRVIVKWASARIITHNGSTLYLKNALSRNVVANDISVFEFTGADAVREIAFYGAGDGANIGEVKMFGGASVPAGFLECNGASLVRAEYPGLFAVIGTVHGTADGTHFNIPDLRGRFPRGYDHGAGNDPDAAGRTAANTGGVTGDNVGSVQDDGFEAHTHGIGATNSVSPGGAAEFPNTPVAVGIQTMSTGGNETRPKNYSLMFVIKY